MLVMILKQKFLTQKTMKIDLRRMMTMFIGESVRNYIGSQLYLGTRGWITYRPIGPKVEE